MSEAAPFAFVQIFSPHPTPFSLLFLLSLSLLTVCCGSVEAKTGDVCISILHEPGEDRYGYESAAERWLPIHTVETIVMSVIAMLSDPNCDSPANVDAAVSSVFLLANICVRMFFTERIR